MMAEMDLMRMYCIQLLQTKLCQQSLYRWMYHQVCMTGINFQIMHSKYLFQNLYQVKRLVFQLSHHSIMSLQSFQIECSCQICIMDTMDHYSCYNKWLMVFIHDLNSMYLKISSLIQRQNLILKCSKIVLILMS